MKIRIVLRKSGQKVLCIGLTIVLVSLNAGTLHAGVQTGGFASAKQKFYIYYNKSYISLSKAKGAAKKWNNVSDNVKLTYSSKKESAKTGIFLHIGKEAPPTQDNLGTTRYYYNGKRVADSKKRDKALCIVYANSDFSLDGKAIRATTSHEVGHALSLTHTYGYTDVMKQGIKNYTVLSETDKSWLKGKWGK